MPGVKAGDDEDTDQRYSYTTTQYLFLLCVTTVKKKAASMPAICDSTCLCFQNKNSVFYTI